MSDTGATHLEGRAEAQRRASALRSDPDHREWVETVRAELSRGRYVSSAERLLEPDCDAR